jgi:hypothetical protein
MVLFKQLITKAISLAFYRFVPVISMVLFSGAATTNAQTVKPGKWIPPVVNLKISGGTNAGRKLLSTGANGAYTDLYDKDDASGRQRWSFKRSADGVSYNILVGGGVSPDRKFLSVTADGSKVDLYGVDDGSGRQRWIVEEVAGESSKIRIRIGGGVTNARKYLSVTPDGSKVDLYHMVDDSGRQLWDWSIPSGVKFNLGIGGGVSQGKTFLSTTVNGNGTWLALNSDSNTAEQRWTVNRHDDGSYSFFIGDNMAISKFISWQTPPVNSAVGQVYYGAITYWTVEDIGSEIVRLRTKNSAKPMYLSVDSEGKRVDTFDRDDASGRQRWKITVVR